ncbi:DUF4123 domain-containing protein [Vibrio algivorus]|uniref:DUF4123 domain-containing protein n=1 Tax=Vibrio algivorus TaxID=1667024 RepID=A0ABQ6EKF4_9VIBR|nr:DUF4123 domain-containing protein [Vibrio algivorus]GLT13469.1 hypothetical protein GCM10007931_04430 [Vibrio algivorus]
MQNSWLNPDWRIQELDNASLDGISSNTSKMIYALIESSLMPNWKVELYQHINQHQLSEPYSESLFSGTHYQHLELGPVVVNITSYPELQTKWLTQFEQAPLGCILVAPSHVQQNHIADLLRNRLTIYKNATPTFLRYYEPRTMLAFIGALSDEERQHFFYPINAVYWHHNQWFQAHWSDPEIVPKQLGSWKMPPTQLNKMTDIMQQIQSHEVLA